MVLSTLTKNSLEKMKKDMELFIVDNAGLAFFCLNSNYTLDDLTDLKISLNKIECTIKGQNLFFLIDSKLFIFLKSRNIFIFEKEELLNMFQNHDLFSPRIKKASEMARKINKGKDKEKLELDSEDIKEISSSIKEDIFNNIKEEDLNFPIQYKRYIFEAEESPTPSEEDK